MEYCLITEGAITSGQLWKSEILSHKHTGVMRGRNNI